CHPRTSGVALYKPGGGFPLVLQGVGHLAQMAMLVLNGGPLGGHDPISRPLQGPDDREHLRIGTPPTRAPLLMDEFMALNHITDQFPVLDPHGGAMVIELYHVPFFYTSCLGWATRTAWPSPGLSWK